MDDVARTDELPSSLEAYEPPRLDDLGRVDELTERPGISVQDDVTTG
jgi:hypothetical protein